MWDVAGQEGFIELKKKLTTTPVLILSSTTKPFIVCYDAFRMGQSGVLM